MTEKEVFSSENVIPNVATEGKKNANVPNLRFDTNDWFTLKLNRYSDFLQGLTYKPSDVSSVGNIVLRSSNIQNGHLFFDDNVFVDMDIPQKIRTKEYDVLMCVRNGSQRLVGKTALILKEYEDLVWGAFMNIIRPKEKNTFLFHYLNSEKFRGQIYADFNTATVNQITIGTLNGCYITIPCSKTSREKIACFLDLIEERIHTQSKIIEELVSLKNSLSHKIFNDKTMIVDFLPLKVFATLKNGYAFKSSSYVENGNYKIITIANVTGERYFSLAKCNTVSSLPIDIQPHQLLTIGDILISLTGNVGRVSYCSAADTLLNQRVGVLEIKNSEYREYIYQVLSSLDFEKNMQSCSQGAAQMNIGKGDVENYLIPVPTNKNLMITISDLLHRFDEEIEIEKDILAAYKKQKAYLLQEMFI